MHPVCKILSFCVLTQVVVVAVQMYVVLRKCFETRLRGHTNIVCTITSKHFDDWHHQSSGLKLILGPMRQCLVIYSYTYYLLTP